MKKLALSDDILLKVDKPARYIGGELNSREKDIKDIDIRFVMCFPDVYEIGMSHIGMQILYDYLNRRDDVYCERLFSPWIDLDKIMREEKIPLFSLESQLPVKSADFLGITLQYEMCYTNILQILELSGIPFHSEDRTENDPIVIGGGPCAFNPEPLADFLICFILERAKWFTMICLTYIRSIKKKRNQGRNFFVQRVRFLASMCHLCMR